MNPEPPRLGRRARIRVARARRRALRAGKGHCGPTGKTRFDDPGSAYAAALRLSHTLGRPIRAYACPDCGGWHLTRRRNPPRSTP